MPWQFTVLASGSAGNASLLDADGQGVLVDVGLGPRQLAGRLTTVGTSWTRVRAALLTHCHTDHWNERTFAYLKRMRVPLYCHREHHAFLEDVSPSFETLRSENLVFTYEVDEPFEPAAGLRCRPFEVRHDGGVTCGFRFDGAPDILGQTYALGYAADLGCWEPHQVRALMDVDVLALEFNHDVQMERFSGRSPQLIARVLSDHGHLSNDQAAGLVREIVSQSEPGRLQHVVQLHLSRDCNRPQLAREAANEVLENLHPSTRLHTAHQDRPLRSITVGGGARHALRPRVSGAAPISSDAGFVQAWFPDFE
jgi:phosphoribosyl 1,2-cyclic phosphodiesterase